MKRRKKKKERQNAKSCKKEKRKYKVRRRRKGELKIQNDPNDERMFEMSDQDDDDEDNGILNSGEENEEKSSTMEKCWQALCPPVSEEKIVGKWLGCIFQHSKTLSLYVGRVTKRFLNDEGGLVAGVEMDCLERELGSAENILKQGKPDVDIFPVKI